MESEKLPIEVSYLLTVTAHSDPALKNFIEKISGATSTNGDIELEIKFVIEPDDHVAASAKMNGTGVEPDVAKNIYEKIQSSNTVFLHNSPDDRASDYYFRRGRLTALHEVILSQEEAGSISAAEKALDNKIKKIARGHKGDLNKMIGRLSERYEVELSTHGGFSSRRVRLGINIKDRNVEVRLPDWGSGTQNRTRILMSILQANRIRLTGSESDRITPIVVVEEPESFLHPTAQAEFGKILQELSEELEIQIIVSTHSPFMLNQVNPSSNLLLKRRMNRGKPYETEIEDTTGDNWHAPFAEHLGIIPPEFDAWKALFQSESTSVVLVEGDIDKEYFDYWRVRFPDWFELPESVDVVPYGGKDALKNTAMLNFTLGKLSKYFVTCDKDCFDEIARYLEKVGLKRHQDFLGVGVDRPGRDCIEGIVPEKVISAVSARETDLIMAMGSADGKARKSAKASFKRKILEEFKTTEIFSKSDLSEIEKLGKVISRRFRAS